MLIWLRMRATLTSLPGMVFEENRNVSPSCSSSPMYFPPASWAEAARRSPWLPVASTSNWWRGTPSISSTSSVGGKPPSTSVARAVFSIVFIARPTTTTCRPAARPASASVLSRATLEAKVVATTMPLAPAISSVIGAASVASDRPGWLEKTLVESQISAFTPLSPMARKVTGSNGSPTIGVASTLKSPECTIRPAGVSITRLELSGIECDTGTKPTLNGPASTMCGQGSACRTWPVSSPARSILPLASSAVKRRAWTGTPSRGHNSPSAPT